MCITGGCAPRSQSGQPAAQNAEPPRNQAANPGEGKKLSVVTTIFPPYDFARQIAGDKAEVTMLLPPGAESHSFEPTPQDIIKIQNCDVFVYNGGDSDAWVDRILGSMDTSGIRVLSMMDMVKARLVEEETVEGMEAEEEDGPDQGPEYDEHVWTSPVNSSVIVSALERSLAEADPANAEAYKAGADDYNAKLAELDAGFKAIVESAPLKELVFGDRFPFRYFAEEYGLKYYAAFNGCSTETEASPATIAFLINKVREDKIPAVCHIELSNEKIADAVCEATGAENLLFHSAHNLTKDDFDAGASYYDIMKLNEEALKKALGFNEGD
jgi:zinc transport system substrate-binding protein